MVVYSSDRFYKEWRFAIDTDFTDDNGQPFTYADNGKQTWGDELKKLPFTTEPSLAAINHDHTVLAVAVERNIHLYEAQSSNFEEIGCLLGHISRIDSLAFQNEHPGVLISCAMNARAGSASTEPTIILWDLGKNNEQIMAGDKEITRLTEGAKTAVVEGLQKLGLNLDAGDGHHLSRELKLPIMNAVARAQVVNNKKLYGRLATSFGSHVFSNSGKHLIYMPGEKPKSNGDDQWDIKIYSMDGNKDLLTLSGHRDAIMWTGYDKGDRYIGTVSWDRTSRIWDATTGELKHTFRSAGQNWTGAFSPNGERFAFTCGDGSVAVYSLSDGNELLSHNFGIGWQRTLAWSPLQDNWLAIGGGHFADLRIFDVEQKQTVQHRKLSAERAKTDDAHRRFIGNYLETVDIGFVDDGRKLVFFTTGDGSAEVYDLSRSRKWRFARTGTDSYPSERDSKPDHEVTSRGGFGMIVWEDVQSSAIFIATVDGDAVRIWKLSRSE